MDSSKKIIPYQDGHQKSITCVDNLSDNNCVIWVAFVCVCVCIFKVYHPMPYPTPCTPHSPLKHTFQSTHIYVDIVTDCMYIVHLDKNINNTIIKKYISLILLLNILNSQQYMFINCPTRQQNDFVLISNNSSNSQCTNNSSKAQPFLPLDGGVTENLP